MQAITGKTTIVGLIGWPVGHSVSPLMHNAAFDALALDWRYIPLPVAQTPAERISEAVNGLRALGMRGANVTVPHKQNVIPFLDQLTPAAQAIGAVNTIFLTDAGELAGDNTDAQGFIADLRDHEVNPTGQDALVLGAGGSARAIVYGLAEAGCATIRIANRTMEKAHHLGQDMQAHFPHCPITAHNLPGDLPEIASNVSLVVNCTSLGMTPNLTGLPWHMNVPFRSDQIVYDLVYNPPFTRLLQKAAADNARGIGGIGMLVWQGAIAFERWTTHAAPVQVMKQAVALAFAGNERKERT